MSEVICKCGHVASIHDMTGCNFPRPYAPQDCICTLSPEAVEAIYMCDALQAKLDIAMEALKEIHQNNYRGLPFGQTLEQVLKKLKEIYD